MTTNNSNKTPAYVHTCSLIQAFVRAEGIELVPQAQTIDGIGGNKNWACFQVRGTEHKIYVPRDADRVGKLHTTVAVDPSTSGWVDHTNSKGRDGRPGKIEAFFSSEPATLPNLLRLWAGTADRLRAAYAPGERVKRLASGQAGAVASGTLTRDDVLEVTAAELQQGA